MADINECLPLDRSSVRSAHDLIKQYIHKTPVLTCKTLDNLASTPQSPEALIGTQFEGQTPAHPKIHFFFKCENYQRIGAFKIRGASHALARLSDEALKNGVVTHSSGSHFYHIDTLSSHILNLSRILTSILTIDNISQGIMLKHLPLPHEHAA